MANIILQIKVTFIWYVDFYINYLNEYGHFNLNILLKIESNDNKSTMTIDNHIVTMHHNNEWMNNDIEWLNEMELEWEWMEWNLD